MQPLDFTYEVRELGISVAALMTAEMIGRRLTALEGTNRIIVPGLCAGALEPVSAALGVLIERGPVDLKDLPVFFGRGAKPRDLSRYSMQIFAEVVDAPNIGVAEILRRAARYRADGANVIDLGCLPGQPFPHLEEAVQALIAACYQVSVDSLDSEELLRGGRAGAHYLLSLKASTLWIADEVAATPILIPEQGGDIASLFTAMDIMRSKNRRFIADSILDPIHFGFTESILRYHTLRKHYPDCEIMMGIGNLTELTDTDTAGMNAMLLGIMSELKIGHLLTTQVSPHARSCVREIDRMRRILYAAHEDNALPRAYDGSLMNLHEKRPFPYSPAEIEELATQIRDPNYRIQVSEQGIHVYNRDGLHLTREPFAVYPALTNLHGDAPHAFYMGAELARAQIAWQLGKRYTQDEELEWGTAAASNEAVKAARDVHAFKGEGATFTARKKNRVRKNNDI